MIIIKCQGDISEPVTVETGIRQGDSLNPLLLNTIMDEILKKIKSLKGYRLGRSNVNILCYADDAVLVAENEDDL